MSDIRITLDPAWLRGTFGDFRWSSRPPQDPKPPAPPSPTQRLADEAARLVKEGYNATPILSAIKAIENEQRATTEKATRGALDLAKGRTATARRFRLAYSDRGSVEIVEGVEFAHDYDTSRDHVFLGVHSKESLPFNGYVSMKRLCEILEERKIIYSIAYVD